MDDDSPVPSPCVRNCCLNEEDVCLGCFRHLQEITEWGGATKERRLEILAAAKARRGQIPPAKW